MPKCPYTFPHRSRKAMLAYLSDHFGYHPMNSWNGGFVLAWNIKVHSFDEMGKSAPADYPVQARFDAQWREHVNDNPELFNELCEDATRYYTHKEWTNYPGVEQGEWEFGINGRSGGYMILEEAPGWLPAPRRWRMASMIWESRSDYQDWLQELDTDTLRQFYRAVRVLDRDLRPEACAAELSYQASFARYNWERDLIKREECDARKQERARPDMYA
jgi:hypothetical protein